MPVCRLIHRLLQPGQGGVRTFADELEREVMLARLDPADHVLGVWNLGHEVAGKGLHLSQDIIRELDRQKDPHLY